MKLSCGCTPDGSGYGYCDDCVSALRKKIWRNMSEKDKNYDRYFDPNGSSEMDGEGCYCHINPPCGYCENKSEEECDE